MFRQEDRSAARPCGIPHTAKETWGLIDSERLTGSLNMSLDEALALRLLRGEGTPVVRFYGWNPPAISLGYHQRRVEVDPDRCAAAGVDIVRRPTGGRAILHDDELTYAVVMRSEVRSIAGVYASISRALARGLRGLGADVEFAEQQTDFRTLYRSLSSIPCFTSAARYEIRHRGRKLVGSAQRRFGEGGDEVVLQHGSVLLGPAHRRIADFLDVDDAAREGIRRDLAASTTDLSAILGRTVTFGETAIALKNGFEEEWGIAFHPEEGDGTRYITDVVTDAETRDTRAKEQP